MVAVVALVAVVNCGGHKAVRIATPPETPMTKTTSSTFSPSQRAFMREGMLQAFYRQLAENTRRATAAERTRELRAQRLTSAEPQPVAVAPSPPGACAGTPVGALIAKYFPAEQVAWFSDIAHRESRCTLGAFNPEGCDTSGRTDSHAYGPLQMCLPLHEGFMAAVGCAGKYRDDACTVAAAAALRRSVGRSPWGGR
jgi:hypothetical protein